MQKLKGLSTPQDMQMLINQLISSFL